jgi:predicted XRE-type DNA-binding protein
MSEPKIFTDKQQAYKQTAADLRSDPDLDVPELLKIYKKNYLKICNETSSLPNEKIMKRFRFEMGRLKKTYDPFKAHGYTDKQRERSLEVRQELMFIKIEAMLEMKAEGMLHKQIAEVLGIHIKSISRYLKQIREETERRETERKAAEKRLDEKR